MATKDPKELPNIKYDTRLAERFLQNGRLDRKEYEAWLKKLPDDEGNYELIEVEEGNPSDQKSGALTFTAD